MTEHDTPHDGPEPAGSDTAGSDTGGTDTGGTDTGGTDTGGTDTGGATGHTTGHTAGTETAARMHSWDCAGPAELELSVDVGGLEITLAEAARTVEVEVRAEHSWSGGWNKGLSSVLSWLGGGRTSGPLDFGGREFSVGGNTISVDGRRITVGGRQFSLGGLGGPEFDLRDVAGHDLTAEAVRAAEVTWSESGRRLVARSSSALPARLVPLTLTVRAPAGSRVTLSTGAGPITVSGTSGTASARTGSGDITLDRVDGELSVRTAAGATSARSVSGRVRARTGSGTVTLDALGGPGELQAGSGDLRLGAVRADLNARTGSGDLTISDAEAGRLDLTTGSGDLRVGVHAGVAAELDLSSGSGRARSELDVTAEPPSAPTSGAPTLRVRGRAGSGDVLVTRALSPTGAAG
jgi:hypothetical protein